MKYKDWVITLKQSDTNKNLFYGRAINHKNNNEEVALGNSKKSVIKRKDK